MSKLTKLVNKPDLFFKDMIRKRKTPAVASLPVSATQQKKPTAPVKKASTPAKVIEKKMSVTTKPAQSPVTRIFDRIRLFSKTAHLLHTGEGMTHGPSHLEQWVGEFMFSGENFAILIRNMDLYKWATQKWPNLDIVYAKNPTDIENILSKLPFLKAIYYFSNTGNLIHTLRYNVYQHIFLGHGDSDKAASAHKFFRVYDEVWVAGQAHIDRFRNAGFNTKHISFVKIGRPNLKNIIKESVPDINFKNSKPLSVTYFPTWEGVYEENNYSSAHISVVMLSEVQKLLNCKVSAKYHPVTGSRDKTLETIGKSLEVEFADRPYMLDVADKTVPVSNIIVGSDAFICDISAVVSECISSLAPIFIYIPKDRSIVTSSSDMHYSDYAYTFSDITQLLQLIERVIINGDDFLAGSRLKALDYLLSVQSTINNEFTTQLKRLSSERPLEENFRETVI